MSTLPDRPSPDLDALASGVGPPDEAARTAALERWATRAKPPGSLGRLEVLAAHVAAVTGACPPASIGSAAVTVFASDHGVVADGASAWPSEVTALMASTMASGQAAINAFAATCGASVTVVDVGVVGDLGTVAGIVDRKVRAGTGSIATGPAMTVDEARAAIEIGASEAFARVEAGADLLVGGDMGIGNTTPSAALIARFTGTSADRLVGPGAGLPAHGLDHKARLIAAAVERAERLDDPIEILAEIGGLEIAALAGHHLAAAASRVPFVVDGVISLAALCTADAIAPGVAARAIAGHRSTEPGATAALDHLGLDPLLDLDLRLGEGTGACLAIPIVQASVRALKEMADLPA